MKSLFWWRTSSAGEPLGEHGIAFHAQAGWMGAAVSISVKD
ncbi:MAG: hypothetical protein P3W87_003540 [Gammaproteobacteria bacterium]|nr:hypothetical protein [Gammaproteobacteria bacterium]